MLPAVVSWLSEHGYAFDSEPGNPGIINVLLEGAER